MPEDDYQNRYEIESDQVADLQKLLSEIIPANRFYTQKLEAAGVDVNLNGNNGTSANNTTTTHDMTLWDGKLGIGTAAPGYKLHITGETYATKFFASTTTSFIILKYFQ